MKVTPPTILIAAVFLTSCASRYSALPADAGTPPNPNSLLKAMSARLSSTDQFRFVAATKVPKWIAEQTHAQREAEIEVLVSRPDKLEASTFNQGDMVRKLIYDGKTLTVVDGVNNFHSKTNLRGTLDSATVELGRIYGFQPPLSEFVIRDPYTDIKRRVTAITYLGRGSVREHGQFTSCHRIGLGGTHADAELWLGIDDSLPRRLTATRSGSGGKDLLADIDFLTWDLNAKPAAGSFQYHPPAGAEEIPMITVEEALKKSNN